MELNTALDFIKQLANGNDPTTGEVMPKDTLLQSVEMSRGLFNVYSTICEALNSKTAKKDTFKITPDQLKQFVFSDEPLKISGITDQLNLLKDAHLAALQPVKITNWLVSQDLLKVDPNSFGKGTRLPSEKGKAIGITTKKIMQPDGRQFIMNLYDKTAQKFILDNLDNILC